MPAVGSVASHVDGARLYRRLMELARFGATKKGGVNRQALSSEDIEARAQLVDWARAIGLEPSVDPAANLFLRLPGVDNALAPVLIGSHIDSQPTGGKFDGAFGVLAALESVEAISEAGLRPHRPIDVVVWMNEEGSRFAPGMMGSAAFAGKRTLDAIRGVVDVQKITVGAEIDKVMAAEGNLARRPLGFPVSAFLEAHIEQGPILEIERKTIGIVTGMQGKRTYRITVEGEEHHAGTSPRSARKDALVSTVAIIGALQDAMWDDADIVRFTVGRLTLAPNAPSVVPASAQFSLDLRHPDGVTLRRLGDLIPAICRANAGRCAVSVQELLYDPPLEFPAAIRSRVANTATLLKLPAMEIASGAGHDARYLHSVCPTGMIFVPCAGGASHVEHESVTEADLTAGARLLAEMALQLASEPSAIV